MCGQVGGYEYEYEREWLQIHEVTSQKQLHDSYRGLGLGFVRSYLIHHWGCCLFRSLSEREEQVCGITEALSLCESDAALTPRSSRKLGTV